ncbi:MAG: hypothetical protein A3H32_08480 [Betaproteobacteria bacterium RIFCSPLOWO2_02_FULL_63_19]|nr:MAG: hypothetical protein A3H32_08480 [Betaproteobacteria bacterium RIFCSPLOWO2_02_FULL_63_19]
MTLEIPVLIAGAGPVGLTLAADLAWRKVASLVVDPMIEVHPHPRAISIGVRSMEHFRRLGLEAHVINAGVPRSQALDVVYVTRMLAREIHRFRFPSIEALFAERERWARAIPEVALSPYFKTWTAQSPLERMLRDHLAGMPQVAKRYGWRVEAFTERSDHVDVTLRCEADGRRETVRTRYLAGCDGAQSAVRAGLGIEYEGRGTLGQALGIHFRAPQLMQRLGAERAVMYWILVPGCAGTIYTIDGRVDWVFNRYYTAGETAQEDDPGRLVRAAIGADIEIEIRSVQPWLPRQLVAQRYASRRVFLAGDACHLFVPTGGFGMNTGIGDAVDLAWKIAAVEHGWGGPQLLATYDAERRPVGRFNTVEAADNYAKSGDISRVPPVIEDAGPAGQAARAAVAALLPPKLKHFAPIGVHLGYHYEDSPLVVPDGTAARPFDPVSYRPTARPGHRAPHAWIDAARSTLDLFGAGFTLLRLSGAAPGADAFVNAAREASVPLSVVGLADPEIAALYERGLVLVRPDGHVAWRGDAIEDAGAVLDRARGAA